MFTSSVLNDSKETLCRHCGQPVMSARAEFCCRGCDVVFHLLQNSGLDHFYALKPPKLRPLSHYFRRLSDFDWVKNLEGVREGRVQIDIEGVQCAACVWLLKEVARQMGCGRCDVDSMMGRMYLDFDPSTFQLQKYLEKIERLGYETRATSVQNKKEDSGLIYRLGLCAFIAMASMFFTEPFYWGLTRAEGPLYSAFIYFNMVLAVLSVLIGGSYFFQKSFEALKHRILHFDLAISLGILAAFAGSIHAALTHSLENAYFDTLTEFIALMLLGRYVQDRFLNRTRNNLLKDQELSHLKVTRLNNSLEEIRFDQVKQADHLLIQPGAVVPVSLELAGESAEFSLAWISGESQALVFESKSTVPAGAILLSRNACEGLALSDFQESSLARLSARLANTDKLPPAWQWVTRWYVSLVLCTALVGGIVWSFIDISKAFLVFTAILVVTCPCALGLAIPMARHLASRALTRSGVMPLQADFFDHWLRIKKIIFDKTGTLTLGTLSIQNTDAIDGLAATDQIVLYQAVAQSRHPASQSIFQYLQNKSLPWISLEVKEEPGDGLYLSDKGHSYRLGKPSAACDTPSDYLVEFEKDGLTLALIRFQEEILTNIPTTITQLHALGCSTYLLSGDQTERVQSFAQTAGINAVYAECSPEEKAAIVSQLGNNDTLMLGDGLNDALAFDRALISGAALSERSVLSAKADFVFVSGSLKWLPRVFATAQRLQQVTSANLAFAGIYNLGMVSLALMGWVSPVVCAIAMPLSSLLVIGGTAAAMRKTGAF